MPVIVKTFILMILSCSTKAETSTIDQTVSLMAENLRDLQLQNNELLKQNLAIKTLCQGLEEDFKVLKSQNDELKALDDGLIRLDDIEARLSHVEQLSKAKVLRSCEELAKAGVDKSDFYEIDPDGQLIGRPPINVYCQFRSDGSVTTEIFHKMHDVPIPVDHCQGSGCFRHKLDYNGVPLEQIQAVISLSASCRQFISFGCWSAALSNQDENLGGWLDRYGREQHFFNGDHVGSHICSCGETMSCSNEKLPCNCDGLAANWEKDSGMITAKDILPITEVFYGQLKNLDHFGNFTIGTLQCAGTYFHDKATTTCQTLKKSGLLQSGIYNLRNPGKKLPELAFCDMEQSIGYEVDELPIGYINFLPKSDLTSFSVTNVHQSQNGMLIFNDIFVNNGQAMDIETGIFKAPASGIYEFTFTTMTFGNYGKVEIFKNGRKEFSIYDWHSGGSYNNFGNTWQMMLDGLDEITLRVVDDIYGGSDTPTVFTGKFITPL